MRKKRIKVLIFALVGVLCAAAILFGALCAVPIVANLVVCGTDIGQYNSDVRYDCILVLGAGLRSDGTPSDMLADRLDVAIDLYNRGASPVIVLSGDRSGEDYDEVTSMRRYCIANGVPAEAIVEDGKGYSTYESVLNIKNDGGYKDIVIVTQKYHLYRAVYIAREMGLTACGADAALRTYRGQVYRDIREVAARTKDFLMAMAYEE